MCRNGVILGMSQESLFPQEALEESTCSQVVSHASRIAVPGSVKRLLTSVIYGVNSRGSFARLSRSGCWLKMCGGYLVPNLDGSLDEFCGTWPTWGTLLDGAATELTPSVRHTSGKESLSWQGWSTPTAQDCREVEGELRPSRIATGRTTDYLSRQVKMWRTPMSCDYKNMEYANQEYLSNQVKLWRTPQSHNGNQGPKSKELYERRLQTNESMITLTDQVRNEGKMWPTPHSNCHTGAGTQGRQGGENLQTAVTWPTPTSRDWKDTGSRVVRPSSQEGSLNPDWVQWLMNFPPGWTEV